MGRLHRGELKPPAVPDASEGLQVLLDTNEIHNMLMTYLRAVDRCDADLLASVYHEDARDERGPHVHSGNRKIAEDIVARITKTSKASTHTLCNELIEVSGNAARSECYCMAYLILPRPDGDYLRQFAGRYVDRWERRNDAQWRIAHRVVILEWGEIRPLHEQDPAWVHFTRGERSLSDRSYSTQ
jgi:ketosteroid isomerase-like protein